MNRTAWLAALEAGGGRILETAPEFSGRYDELELQARWFAGEFGREGCTTDGRTVVIEDFGRWNHEAGPDFVHARVRIGDTLHRGAIELDIDARDWEAHGHATNPAFRDTVLHVFLRQPRARFFTRSCDFTEVPQWRLAIPPSAKSSVRAPTPEVITEDEDRARKILSTAARHRMDSKAAAWRRYAKAHGEDDAWFAALAVALGYKRNQIPALLLAQRVGLKAARGSAGEALLFGVAGFLEGPEPIGAARIVRGYLRSLWQEWWKIRAPCARWILPGNVWTAAGVRPGNHPHRRVAAVARISAEWPRIRGALEASDHTTLLEALASLSHPFWSRHFNLQTASLPAPCALIGGERRLDISINIHFPPAIDRSPSAWDDFLALKGPAPTASLRASARQFFGAVADVRGFLSSAVCQQGLLQLEKDHRLSARPEAFLAAVRKLA